MADQREDKGRLWLYKNDYAENERHPFKTGNGEISKEFLRHLVEKAKATNEDVVKVNCAAWERVSQKGNPYVFVTIEPERAKKQDARPAAVDSTSAPRTEEIEPF